MMFLMQKGVDNLWHQGCMHPQNRFLKPPELPISQLLKIIRSFPFQVGNSHASPPENHSLLCVVHSYTLCLDAQTTVTLSPANMTKPAPTSQMFFTPRYSMLNKDLCLISLWFRLQNTSSTARVC